MSTSLSTPEIKNKEFLGQQSESFQQSIQPQEVSLERYRTVTEKIFEKIAGVVDCKTASVQIIQGDSRILIGSRGVPIKISSPEQRQGISSDDLVRPIIQQKCPLVLPDVNQDPRWGYSDETKDIKSWMGIPLIVDHEVIGLITVDHPSPNYYSQEIGNKVFDAVNKSFTLSTDIRKITLKEAEILHELDESERQLKQLLEVGKIVNSTLEFKKIIGLVLTQLQEVVEYDGASIQSIDGDSRKLLEGRGLYQKTLPKPRKKKISSDPLIRKIVEKRKPYLIRDVTDKPELGRNDLSEMAKIQSWIGAPLVFENTVIGLLIIGHKQAGKYTVRDRNLVAAFADLVANAVHNSIQLKALADLNKLSRKIVSIQDTSPDKKKLFQQVADKSLKILNADIVELYEYVQERDTFELPPISSGIRIGPEVPKHEIKREDDIVCKFISQKTPKYIPDVKRHRAFRPFKLDRGDLPKERFVVREGIISTAVIPLRTASKTVGLMFVSYRIAQNFAPEQKNLIKLFANYAAIAINNCRLAQQLTSVNERLTSVNQRQAALVELGHELSSSIQQSEDQILGLIYDKASKLMHTANMYIALYDETSRIVRFKLVYVEGKKKDDPESSEKWKPRRINEGGRTEWIVSHKEPRLFKTFSESKEFYGQPGHKEHPGTEMEASWMGVPMIIGDKVLGVITVHHHIKEHAYNEDDQEILSSIANQAAIALENARLYHELHRRTKELAELNKKQTHLIEFGQKSTSTIQLTENEILQLIHKNASKLMDTNNMYIALYDERTEVIRFPLLYERAEQKTVPVRKIDKEKRGRTEEIILTGNPILIQTKDESEAWYQQPGRQEFRGFAASSWIGVPMKLGEKVLGVVATYHLEKDYVYSEDDLEILQDMANSAAIALENASLVKQTQGEIANREGEHVMSGLAMDFAHKINNLAGPIPPWLELIKRKLSPECKHDPKIMNYLKNIEDDVRLILKEANDLRKPGDAPELIRIEEVIGSIVGQMEMMTTPNIDIIFKAESDLPTLYCVERQFAMALYNVIQNAIKSITGKGQIRIELKTRLNQSNNKSEIEINISDNGCGIPKDRIDSIFNYGTSYWSDKSGTGYGLWRARDILQRLGGNINVVSVVGESTTFTIILPVETNFIKPEDANA